MSKDNPCRSRTKHWFSTYGRPRDVQEFCVRGCGTRNPKWETYKKRRALYDRIIAASVNIRASESGGEMSKQEESV